MCDKIFAVLQGDVTAKELPAFKRTKRVRIDFATSDNNMAYKKFCSNSMGLGAGQCISHLTGKLIYCVAMCLFVLRSLIIAAIAKKRGIHKKSFTNPETYDIFYGWVSKAGNCPHEHIRRILPDKICEKMR